MKPTGDPSCGHVVEGTPPVKELACPHAQSKAPHTIRRRRLIVMGSTGSIGVNTLKVVEHLNDATTDELAKIDVVGLAAGRDVRKLIQQAHRFDVKAVAIADTQQGDTLRQALPKAEVYVGPDASRQLVESTEATDVSAAIVGIAGLPGTLAAVRKGLTVGLANKETLVAAGPLVMPLVGQNQARLIPVDSEHSAVFQCLAGRTQEPLNQQLRRIVLTASGGPFRTVDKKIMNHATVEQALNHPTWQMGPKITVDSATMMNKALEIIEAHWLFGLPAEKIQVIIHPQSMIHSFVEFTDNSILAQLGPPDMKTPIQYALAYPHRHHSCSQALDWTTLGTLEFEQPDHDKFAAIALAYKVIEAGGTAGAIFNAANEAAVTAFLNRKIRFGRIVELVDQALAHIQPHSADSLDTILSADQRARAFVAGRINS